MIGAGLGTLVVGGFVVVAPWYESAQWQASPEAARAQRNADVPTPIWITPAPASAAPLAAATRQPRAPAARLDPTPAPPAAAPQPARPTSEAGVAFTPVAVETPVPTPTLAVSTLKLAATQFQFLDPPEPGANARLSVSVHNPTDAPGGQISLILPLNWLSGYRIQGLDPAPVAGTQTAATAAGSLRLTFDGPDAQADRDLIVDVVAVDEVIDAPMLQVLDDQGAEVGRVRPPTEAPPPRPGPIYSIDIPNLHLHAGVVPVDWEPPLFVVGQLRASAYVTKGNSVLIGHLRGAQGYNVFDHLDQLAPGDRIIASSRGETYDFVVSQTQVLPEDDTSPTDSTSTSRLTLMTCAGTWNPLTRDYSDRLWVTAEPADATAASPAVDARSDATAKSAAPQPTQPSARGGLGNTDADLAAAFGPPVGESSAGLAVYRTGAGSNNAVEHRAQLGDSVSGTTPRAALVAYVPRADAPLSFDAAVGRSRGLLPNDAQPRSSGPEGNPRFIVERFSSQALAAAFPAETFADHHGQPGDLIVVYARRPDGRVGSFAVGIGDDAQALLSSLDG